MSSLDDTVHALVVADDGADVARSARHHALRTDPLLHGADLEGLVARVVARVSGLGPLQPLVDDPAVSEVMVNAGRDVWVERHGHLERCDLTLDPELVEHLIERVVAPLGRRIDRSSPLVDARLPGGARVHAVVPPLAIDGPALTIRRFATRRVALDEFAPPDVAELVRRLVRSRANVVVCGPTSSGKTTLLNAIAAEIEAGERIITIEDAAELRLPGAHVVRLEARPPNAEGDGEVTVRELVRAALRMRPDRLVVGEVRGAEAMDMVTAMSTGHDGSLSTCHANSALDALRRIEVMVLQGGGDLPLDAVRELVHAAVDVVVHVARGEGGRRRVLEVVEVAPPGDGRDRWDAPDPGSPGRVRLLADASGCRGEPVRRLRWVASADVGIHRGFTRHDGGGTGEPPRGAA